MAKLLNKLLRNLTVRNAPSGGSSSGGGLGSGFNRDPKAVQVKRIGYQISNAAGGSSDAFEAADADFEQITNAITRDSYLQQAVMKYSELLFKSGYNITGKNDQALQYLNLRLKMMAIATGIPTHELWKGIGEDIVRYSNAFLVKARAKGGVGLAPGLSVMPVPPSKDPIAGYFRLPPQTMTIKRDENGTVKKYQQSSSTGGDPKEFNPEDIVHIKVNVPSGKAFGLPFLAPVLEDVRLLRKMEENVGLLMYRHIFPLLAYQVGIAEKGYEATDEELEELRAVIEDMPTDGAIVLPERHKIEPVKIDTLDAKPYLEYFENRVFAGTGLSQVDFGRGDTANRNTADAMTGQKADRVKGWQQDIQEQIDKYIIEELLVEGGFDPMVNPEFDCDFVFNEIELERQIAKETHEIFKFNSNIQSWEETRIAIGMEPSTDESRLQFQMIGMAQAEHASQLAQAQTAAEAQNKNQPTNQNGTRSGPKSKTEQLHDQYFHEKMQNAPRYHYTKTNELSYKDLERLDSLEMGEVEESIFERADTKYDPLVEELNSMFNQVESEAIEELQRIQNRNSSLEKDSRRILTSFNLQKDKMSKSIRRSAESIFEEGSLLAKQDLGEKRSPKFNKDLALQTIASYIDDSLNSLKEQLETVLNKRLEESDSKEDELVAVKGTFEALRHKMKVISRATLARSYNYGYALSLIYFEEKEAKVKLDSGSCKTCKDKSESLISLKQLSSLDEVAIFYRIPPWHPNCECELQSVKGGER